MGRQETTSGLTLSENQYHPDQYTPRHTHETMLFYFVLDGICTEKVKQSSTDHGASALVLLQAGEVHSTHWAQDSGGRCFHLELSDRFLLSRFQGSLSPVNAGCHFYTDGPPITLMRRLRQEYAQWDSHSAIIAEGIVLELLGQCRRWSDSSTPRSEYWLSAVEARLRDISGVPPTLSNLAEIADVHPSHLLRVFRQKYHVTPGEFLRQLRIEEACTRLRQVEDISLSNLASELGFADQSHFSRIFRKKIGVSPGSYRKKYSNVRKLIAQR